MLFDLGALVQLRPMNFDRDIRGERSSPGGSRRGTWVSGGWHYVRSGAGAAAAVVKSGVRRDWAASVGTISRWVGVFLLLRQSGSCL
jgi:hypothetical protein